MKSIQRKLSSFIIALVFLSCAIITATALVIFYGNTVDQIEQDTQALADAYSTAIQKQIEAFKSEIKVAGSIEELTDDDTAGRDATLARLAQSTGFQYLALSDANGKTTRNSDISEREYFQKAMGGEVFMSSPLINKVDGSVTIMMAAPINNGSGYRGIIYGGILFDTFNAVIDDIRVGEGGYAFAVDKYGTVVAHPNIEMVQEMRNYIEIAQQESGYEALGEIISRMTEGETAVDVATFEGVERFYSYTPIEGPEGWSVAVSVPMTQAMAGIYRAVIFCLVILLILLVIGTALALIFSRSITKPIVAITQRIELLADGNLSADVPSVKGRDELARLSTALEVTVMELYQYIGDISNMLHTMSMNDFTQSSAVEYKGEFLPIKNALGEISSSLNRTLSIINLSTEQVSTGADQVSSGAQALATGSAEQAASVEELSSLIEQVADQAEGNLTHVQIASDHVEQMASGMKTGNEHMAQLTDAMHDISDSSAKIANITKTIEDIAFQTNILALNAAIEAAAAGSAGKGFAVVADEVRNLAVKSADAAKQTTDLISSSVQTIAKGRQITEETAEILSGVGESALQVAQSFTEIKAASAEQTEEIEQIKTALSQVSSVVQNNAATAQQNSATSEEMSAQAATLREEVARFKLDTQENYSEVY